MPWALWRRQGRRRTLAEMGKEMVIASVEAGSQADLTGLCPGDVLMRIGSGPARDFIDLMYYGDEDEVPLTVRRGGGEFTVVLDGREELGIEFEPSPPRVCGNRCVFCFVDQNPKGMRAPIYLRDEDYRYSFLYGSYVTLTGLCAPDLDRIIEQHLSPLYVSVHATDPAVRMTLLGLKKPDGLMEKLERLTGAGIRLHTQIVVCPGINDGEVLERTIADLKALSLNVLSVAVVPVGLTRHREGLYPLTPVDGEHARRTIALVDRFHGLYRDEVGDGFVYCADEWYLRAGMDVPPEEYYDDYPQIENGVGMVRQFLEDTADLSYIGGRTGSFAFVTGTSMAPLMTAFTARLSELPGIEARTVGVVNDFYGDTVTVSGLLTGGDIGRALAGTESHETVVLPPNCLNDDGLFLDGLTPDDLSHQLGVTVVQGGYDPLELFE